MSGLLVYEILSEYFTTEIANDVKLVDRAIIIELSNGKVAKIKVIN